MKHNFAAILFFFLLFSETRFCAAQQVLNYDWLYTYIPFHGTYGTRMIPDDAGNTYIIVNNTNSYRDTIHGKSIKSNAYISRLLKIDPSGALIWERIIQPERNKERKNEGAQPYLIDVVITPKGDVLVIGNISGRIVFPSGKDSITKGCLLERERIYDGMKGFMLSYSESGKLNWINELSYLEQSDRIGFNAKGDLFLKVTYNRTLRIGNKSIDPVENEWHSPFHYSLLQLDLKGNFKRTLFRWEEIPWKSDDKTYNRIENFDFTFDKKDNLVLYGLFVGSIRLSPALTLYCTHKYNDSKALFIAKYSPDLKLLWQKKIGGRGSAARMVKPVFNRENDVYFAGSFHTECFISDGSSQSILYESKTSHSGTGFFYGKMNEQGDLQFSKFRLQPQDYTEVNVQALILDDVGNAHILGSYNDSLQFAANGLVLFPGKTCETKTFDYEGKNLEYTYCQYQSCFYYSVWREDTLIHLQNLAEFKGYSHQQLTKSAFIRGNKLIFSGEYGLYEAYVESEKGKIIIPSTKIGGGLLLAQVNLPILNADTINEKSDSIASSQAFKVPSNDSLNLSRIDENRQAENLLHRKDSISLAIQEIENEKQVLSVFPNPFVNEFTLNVKHPLKDVELRLYNASGQLIQNQMIETIGESEPLKLEFSHLADGSYFLVVKAVNFKQIVSLVRIN